MTKKANFTIVLITSCFAHAQAYLSSLQSHLTPSLLTLDLIPSPLSTGFHFLPLPSYPEKGALRNAPSTG